MAILILCKKEIRDNKRQFEAFIRSQIDAKIFDLSYKCQGFTRKIDHNGSSYKNFKRVMDKRNHVIHGNIDPEREQTEIVYFEGKRPLFREPAIISRSALKYWRGSMSQKECLMTMKRSMNSSAASPPASSQTSRKIFGESWKSLILAMISIVK